MGENVKDLFMEFGLADAFVLLSTFNQDRQELAEECPLSSNCKGELAEGRSSPRHSRCGTPPGNAAP
jgi:hypothetical protein